MNRVAKYPDGCKATLLLPKEVENTMDKLIDLNKWISDVKEYVKEFNDGELMESRDIIFAIECQTFCDEHSRATTNNSDGGLLVTQTYCNISYLLPRVTIRLQI